MGSFSRQTSSFDAWLKNREETIGSQKAGKSSEDRIARRKTMEKVQAFATLESFIGSGKIVRDVTELRRLFGQFDDDGSGFIEPSEFLPLLAKLLRQPVSHLDPAEVWRSWEDVDESHSGRILVEQFTHWYCNTFNVAAPDFTQFINQDIIPESEKLIREVAKKLGKNTIMIEKIYREFNKLDADNSGFLEFPEFEQLMVHELSPDKKSAQVPRKVLQKFWIDIDADDSGGVSFEEFATWYLRFFHGSISPMEQYYHMLGSGYRRMSCAGAAPGVMSALSNESEKQSRRSMFMTR